MISYLLLNGHSHFSFRSDHLESHVKWACLNVSNHAPHVRRHLNVYMSDLLFIVENQPGLSYTQLDGHSEILFHSSLLNFVASRCSGRCHKFETN